MSENTFPFGEAAATPDVEEAEGARNKKAMLVAGGVAAALVVAAGGWFLLGGGGSSSDSALVVPQHSGRVVAAAPKTAALPAVKLPAAYKAQLGRDPFKALYVVPVAAVAPVTAVAPTGTTTTTPTGTSPGTSTSTTTSSTPPATQYSLKLLAISQPSPETRFTTWLVDGQKKTVIPAQRFGKYGELVVLAFGKNAQGVVDSAIIQVGDDSPMDVTIGQSVSVL